MSFFDGLRIRTKVVLLAGIPVLGTLVLAGIIAQRAQTQLAAAAALGSIEDVAQLSVKISTVIHALQLERAEAALSEGLQDRKAAKAVEVDLQKQTRATDTAERSLEVFLANRDLRTLPARLARDLGIARKQAAGRHEFQLRLQREEVTIDEILSFYGAAADALVSATAALTELSDDGELLRTISSLVALAQLSERASREHALLSFVFGAREFPPGAFKTLVTLTTEQDVYAAVFRANAHGNEAHQYDAVQQSEPVIRARAMRSETLNSTSDELDADAGVWFDAAAGQLSKLQAVEQALLSKITTVATYKLQTTRSSVQLGWWLSIAVVFASGLLAWFIARGVTRSIVDLSAAAAQVRETNNFGIRAKKTSRDELGTLADTFNEMLAMIEARDTYLEAQVSERTEELRRTLAELWTEMDLAQKIQTVLLPQEPEVTGFDVSAKMVPASSVGGDYYDVYRSGGVDWILIGDVSGHGVTAGLSMMIVQTAVRTVLQSAGDHGHTLTPKQLLTSVNTAVRSNLQKIHSDQYMTIMALRVEGDQVSFAGLHQDILVYRASTKKVERIETSGIWVGLVDDINGLVENDQFSMADGDVILLYTDGVTEIANDNGNGLLGTDGLAAVLGGLAKTSSTPSDIVRGVIEKVGASTVDDDVTVVAARYNRQLRKGG
jgi:serine phosphatase RsbU (regulator of sigma subunit)